MSTPRPSGSILLLLLLCAAALGGCAELLPWSVLDKPLIQPGVGVGPIHFGMKKEEVFRKLGWINYSSIGSTGTGAGHRPTEYKGFFYDGKHLIINIYSYPDVGVQEIYIAIYDDYVRLPWYITPRTTLGIGIGSSRKEVATAYGPPSRQGLWKNGSGWVEYAQLGMDFYFDALGKIEYITLHRPELGTGDASSALAKEYEASHK